jgi:hypothetical protein
VSSCSGVERGRDGRISPVGVSEHMLGLDFDLILGVEAHRKPRFITPQKALKCDPHGITGGFLVPPVVDLQFLRLQGLKQPDGDFLDSLDFGGAESPLLQEVEYGQGFLTTRATAETYFVQFIASLPLCG